MNSCSCLISSTNNASMWFRYFRQLDKGKRRTPLIIMILRLVVAQLHTRLPTRCWRALLPTGCMTTTLMRRPTTQQKCVRVHLPHLPSHHFTLPTCRHLCRPPWHRRPVPRSHRIKRCPLLDTHPDTSSRQIIWTVLHAMGYFLRRHDNWVLAKF